MREYIGKICPFCKTVFQAGDDIVICSDCDMPHHKDCWVENRGCTTFGCMGSIRSADGPSAVTVRQLEYEDMDQPEQAVFCTQCGRKNSASSTFCFGCGTRLTVRESQSSVKHTFTPAMPEKTDPYAYVPQPYAAPRPAGAASSDPDVIQLIGPNSEY